jgi:hypothetical protein
VEIPEWSDAKSIRYRSHDSHNRMKKSPARRKLPRRKEGESPSNHAAMSKRTVGENRAATAHVRLEPFPFSATFGEALSTPV